MNNFCSKLNIKCTAGYLGKMTLMILILVLFNRQALAQAGQLTPIGSTLGSVTNTDDSNQEVSITSVFNGGIKFGTTVYTTMFVSSNGYVTFGHGNSGYSPLGIAGYTAGPIIAGQYDDLHAGISGDIYYSQNSDYVVVTYSSIPPYCQPPGYGSGSNTFQIVLRRAAGYNGSSNLNFQIEIRYMNLSWAKSCNNSAWPTAGWSTGTGTVYDVGPYSGTSSFTSNASSSNIGETGVFRWDVQGGIVQSPPTVNVTDVVTSVTGNSGFSGGNVSADGGVTVTGRGLAYAVTQTPTISNSTATSGSGTGTFTATMTGLSPGTTYYVRAYATNSLGTGYGPQRSFTTANVSPPTVTTSSISSITTNSASSGSTVTNNGGSTVSVQGIVWNGTGSPTTASNLGTSSGSLTGLSPNITYYVRAYATNSAGTSYGAQLSFITVPTAPTNPVATPSTICRGASSSLTVSNGQGAVNWYTAIDGSGFVGTGNPLTVAPVATTTYFARNNNASGTSAFTSGITLTVNQPASQPASASVSVAGGSIGLTTASLTWGASTGLTPVTYYWSVGTSSGVTYESGYTSRGTTSSADALPLSATTTGLQKSTTYYLRVKAANSCNPSGSAYVTSTSFRTNSELSYLSGTNGSLGFDAAGGSPFATVYVANNSSGIPIYAVPNSNYHFVNWSDGSTANPRTDTGVTNSISVTANFALNILEFTTQPGNTIAGDNIVFTVKVKDVPGGNIMTNSDQDITLSISTNPAGGTLTGTTLHLTNGTVSSTATKITKTGTGYKLTALASPMSAAVSVAFNITPAPIDHFTVAGIITPHIAGTTTTPVVIAYDVYNNIKTDYTGTISFSSPETHIAQEIFPANYTFQASDNGQKTFTNGTALKTAGIRSVAVTGDGKTGSQTGITVQPTAVYSFVLSVDGPPVTAGVPFTVTARVYDEYNNLKTDYEGAKNIAWSTNATLSPNGTARIIPSSFDPVTFTAGVASTIPGFTLYNSAETPTITITDGPTAKYGTTAGITVNNAPLDNFKVESLDNVTHLPGTNQTSGAWFDVRVTARDFYWNTAITYAGNIRFKSSNDALVIFPAGLQSFAGTGGVKTYIGTSGVKINTSGAYWIRVADQINPGIIGDQQNIIVGPGAFSPLSISGIIPISTLTISDPATPANFVDPLNRVAGEFVYVTLTPRDAQGNLLYSCQDLSLLLLDQFGTSYGGPFAINNLGNGTYSANIQVTRTGANIINAQLGATLFGQTRTVNVSPAPTDHYLITDVSSINAGSRAAYTVTRQDFYNHPTTDGAETVYLTSSSDGTQKFFYDVASGGVSVTSITIPAGSSTANFWYYEEKAGSWSVTVSDLSPADGDAGINDASDALIVVPATVDHFVINAPGNFAAGASRAAYTVVRQDIFNNVFTSGAQTVYISSSSTGVNKKFYSTATGSTVITQVSIANGSSQANFWYYDEKTGDHTISASDNTPADGDAGINDASDQITVTPGLLKNFLVYGIPDAHDLGTWQSFTVEARDYFNNRKTDYVGTVTFSNTDDGATNPADHIFVSSDQGIHQFDGNNGTGRVKFSKTGNWWLYAIDLDEPGKNGYQADITVQRAVTIKANNRSKTYGDALSPVLGTTAYTITGIVSGVDPVPGEITSVTLTCPQASSLTASAGSYNIIPGPVVAGSYDPDFYRIEYVNGTLTVDKRAITVTASANTKTYDGTTSSAASPAITSGTLAGGDMVNTSPTQTYDTKVVGTSKILTPTGLTLKTISDGADMSASYDIQYVTNTNGVINKLQLTVADPTLTKTKDYDGSTVALVTAGVLTNKVGSEAVTVSAAANYDNKNQGTEKQVTVVYSIAGADAGNYLAPVNLVVNDGVINKLQLTVTAVTDTKTYDGTTGSSASPVIGTLISGDVVNVSPVQVYDNKNYGLTHVLTASGLTIKDALNADMTGNYTITYAASSATGVINKAALTVTAPVIAFKVYDGTNTAGAVGALTLSGFASGETVTATAVAAAYSSANSGTYYGVAVIYTLHDGTGNGLASNYSLANGTATGIISPKELTISEPTIASKVYDGTKTAGTLTIGALSGFAGSETVTASAAAAEYSGKNVGTYPGVKIIYTLHDGTGGGLASNYNLSDGSASGIITRKSLTISAPSIASKVYDGMKTAGTVTIGSLSGFVGDERVSATTTAADYSSKNAGTYPGVLITYTLHDETGGGLASNYSLANGSATGVISKKTMTIKANNLDKCFGETLIFSGSEFTVSGLISGESVVSVLLTSNGSSAGTTAGNYVLTPSAALAAVGTSLSNYDIIYSNGLLVVKQLPVPAISGPSAVCNGTSGNIYTTESNMRNYTWTISAGGTISSGEGTNTIKVDWKADGNQFVGVNYSNQEDCRAMAPVIKPVMVNPLPGTAGAISGSTSFCAGSVAIPYSIAPIANATSYTWSLPSGATILSGSGTSNITASFPADVVSGNMTVIGSNQCGTSNVSVLTLNIQPLTGAAGVITGPGAVCQGSTGLTFTVAPVVNAKGYTWNLPSGATIVSGVNTNKIVVDLSMNGTGGPITVKGINDCNQGTVSPVYNLTVNPIPSTPVVNVSGSTIVSSAPMGNQWFISTTENGAGTVVSAATNQSFTPGQTGWYYSVVSLNGCVSDESNRTYRLKAGAENLYAVYPVPNNGEFTVQITTAGQEEFIIQVYNQLGQKLFEMPRLLVNGLFKQEINLENVATGIYSVVIRSKTGDIEMKKFNVYK